MANFIVAAILAIMIGAAILYIVKEKKKGTRCIGCPSAGQCTSGVIAHGGCECGCHSHAEG
ncbi:MAG: FeoB-associated Cys-rich membrane protein [Lachnospiraceae bacterium]|nr:FeoB-associated Cys-rich membrane protein [Lachnospiraceae bacterium]MDD7027442.1 FeoB-associated Cys-rich membrane protein [Lachnospiraceae bacterium]MDY5701305.1 FeoB-associated Cys-rich membrane protein [Lachnospiraceae bacterium]